MDSSIIQPFRSGFIRASDWIRRYWKKPVGIALLLILLFVIPIPFAGRYWIPLFSRSISEAWMLVFEKTWASIIIAGLLWGLGFYREHPHKWREQVKEELFKVFAGLKLPIGVFIGIFLIHLFMVTPARIISEKSAEAAEAQKQSRPTPFEVKVTSENKDEEARKQLDETRKDLAAATQRIKQLDLKLQPLASATMSVTVFIDSEAQLGIHYMDSGAYAAFCKKQDAMLITKSA